MQTFEQVQVSSAGGIDEIRARLMAREFLYDSPSDYRDGVAAALEAVRVTLREAEQDAPPARAAGC